MFLFLFMTKRCIYRVKKRAFRGKQQQNKTQNKHQQNIAKNTNWRNNSMPSEFMDTYIQLAFKPKTKLTKSVKLTTATHENTINNASWYI